MQNIWDLEFCWRQVHGLGYALPRISLADGSKRVSFLPESESPELLASLTVFKQHFGFVPPPGLQSPDGTARCDRITGEADRNSFIWEGFTNENPKRVHPLGRFWRKSE